MYKDDDGDDDDDENNNDADDDKDGTDETKDISKLVSPDTERKGTEMVFRNMQLYYFSASILVERLQLSIQCERCKQQTEFSTPPNRVNSVTCGKCSSSMLVLYRAVLAHPYSSTFGYLDLEGCVAFDVNLQKSVFSITCMQCNKSSTVKVIILIMEFCNIFPPILQNEHELWVFFTQVKSFYSDIQYIDKTWL